jgi:hypothetical protein
VKLAPDGNGFYAAVSIHPEPVAVTSPEVLIRGRVAGGMSCGGDYGAFCETLQVRYNIEQYFVPEAKAPTSRTRATNASSPWWQPLPPTAAPRFGAYWSTARRSTKSPGSSPRSGKPNQRAEETHAP